MNTDITLHQEFFAHYAKSFCLNSEKNDMLELKIQHTEHVLAHMQKLVHKERTLIPHARACLLGALYHDIGRFLQFSQYGTFKDALSVNHATLGAKVLHKQGFLQQEPPSIRRQVLIAVALHNRYALPKSLSPSLRTITLAVRDADKLDILRVMAEHFSQKDGQSSAVTFYAKDEPLLWSEKIYSDVLQNRLASYNDIVYINDFKLLLCSWIHELAFHTTKNALAKSGYLERIIADLPPVAAMQTIKDYVKKQFETMHNG